MIDGQPIRVGAPEPGAEVVGVVVGTPDRGDSDLIRVAKHLHNAGRSLDAAGLSLVLLDRGVKVRAKRSRFRRWWRGRQTKGEQ
jgi:hypothetical protein